MLITLLIKKRNKKKLRGFQKGTGEPTVEIPKGEGKQITIPGAGEELHYQTGGGFEETNPNDLRPPVEKDILPKLPGHEKDPHSYRVDENGQYYYKLGDGDWKPAPKGGAWDKAIKKRYEDEMPEIFEFGTNTTEETEEVETEQPIIGGYKGAETDFSILEAKNKSKTKTKKKTKKGDFKFKDKFNYGGQGFNF